MNRTKIKGIFFFTSLALLITMLCFSMTHHAGEIMGVEFIDKDEYSTYVYDENIKPTFRFNNVLAPIDYNTKTIYISQNITSDFTVEELQGTLSVEQIYYDVKLVKDENYNNLYDAMRNNYKFEAIVVSANNTYTVYNLVFTSLPVVILDGDYIGNNEEGKAAYAGNVYVFNSLPNDNNGYKIESCAGDWHVRGATSANHAKRPYKVNLKNKKGNSKDLSLLELGTDDDWILNPLNMDDLKIREKVCMELWTQMSQTNQSNKDMSSGEYVEVIRNDTYQGIYLLQRRVDKKYLKLDDADMLFKVNGYEAINTNLEIKHSKLDTNETNKYIESYFVDEYIQNMDIDNYTDVHILTQFASLFDNLYKNRFFLVEDYDTNPTTKIILWDTDMAFGLRWVNRFAYDLEYAITSNAEQNEYQKLLELNPDLFTKISNRYNELRKTVLTYENVKNIAKTLYDNVNMTGAVIRDYELYGTCYNGEDTIDNFYKYINGRLTYLDNYFKEV